MFDGKNLNEAIHALQMLSPLRSSSTWQWLGFRRTSWFFLINFREKRKEEMRVNWQSPRKIFGKQYNRMNILMNNMTKTDRSINNMENESS